MSLLILFAGATTAQAPFTPQVYTANINANPTPALNVNANPTPALNVNTNPSPTQEVEIG